MIKSAIKQGLLSVYRQLLRSATGFRLYNSVLEASWLPTPFRNCLVVANRHIQPAQLGSMEYSLRLIARGCSMVLPLIHTLSHWQFAQSYLWASPFYAEVIRRRPVRAFVALMPTMLAGRCGPMSPTPIARSETVPCLCLQRELEHHQVVAADAIAKIDVEGFELAMLQGFGSKLEQLGAVMVELTPRSLPKVGHLLEQCGLRMFYIDERLRELVPLNQAGLPPEGTFDLLVWPQAIPLPELL